ncbi:hypothetical protein PVAND_017567 [Polypedilum vanderplanki]|uniref:Glycine-rich protein n=1 Tax=Polypedilum vanderplanki TaxID=319348 RepID=A0A9J6BIN7_POLVA|nr:hypothetical protein PVAND_017567 [Polypedilum vanderplanki]
MFPTKTTLLLFVLFSILALAMAQAGGDGAGVGKVGGGFSMGGVEAQGGPNRNSRGKIGGSFDMNSNAGGNTGGGNGK